MDERGGETERRHFDDQRADPFSDQLRVTGVEGADARIAALQLQRPMGRGTAENDGDVSVALDIAE